MDWLYSFSAGFSCAHSSGCLQLDDSLGWDIQSGLTHMWLWAGAPFSPPLSLSSIRLHRLLTGQSQGSVPRKQKWKVQSLLRPRPGTAKTTSILLYCSKQGVKPAQFHRGRGPDIKGMNTKRHNYLGAIL